MRAEYKALVGRIDQSLTDLRRVVDRAEMLLDKARRSNDDGYLDGVALNLHGFYSGVERIFRDIARTLEEVVPGGPDWHRDLPLQMSAEVANVRPAVISLETRYCLDEYRGFRHVVRNVYTFTLRPGRLQELVSELRPCYQAVERDLSDFVNFLQGLSEEEE